MTITTSTLLIWAALLLLQNASFTWVSRARNGGSDAYHAVAAVFSNGIWFAANFFTFGQVLDVMRTGSVPTAVGLGVVYVVCTVVGSVASGWFLRTYVEKGKRRVGHYADIPSVKYGSDAAQPLGIKVVADPRVPPGAAIMYGTLTPQQERRLRELANDVSPYDAGVRRG